MFHTLKIYSFEKGRIERMSSALLKCKSIALFIRGIDPDDTYAIINTIDTAVNSGDEKELYQALSDCKLFAKRLSGNNAMNGLQITEITTKFIKARTSV